MNKSHKATLPWMGKKYTELVAQTWLWPNLNLSLKLSVGLSNALTQSELRWSALGWGVTPSEHIRWAFQKEKKHSDF